LYNKENQPITKCSSNKGFSGKSNNLPRSHFGAGGQFFRPQSLTTATLDRYVAFKNELQPI